MLYSDVEMGVNCKALLSLSLSFPELVPTVANMATRRDYSPVMLLQYKGRTSVRKKSKGNKTFLLNSFVFEGSGSMGIVFEDGNN